MKRLQFDIPDERVKELDDLVERTGLKTRAQLFNSALTLFEWAIREREAGHTIASVDEAKDKYKEVEMPGFPAFKERMDPFTEAFKCLNERFTSINGSLGYTLDNSDYMAVAKELMKEGLSSDKILYPDDVDKVLKKYVEGVLQLRTSSKRGETHAYPIKK